MSEQQFLHHLDEMVNEAIKKPVAHRLRTHALGDDPDPIIVFEISNLGTFTLDLTRSEPPFVVREDRKSVKLRAQTDWDTFHAIWTKKLSFWKALRTDRLRIIGNLRLAHGLQRYFTQEED